MNTKREYRYAVGGLWEEKQWRLVEDYTFLDSPRRQSCVHITDRGPVPLSQCALTYHSYQAPYSVIVGDQAVCLLCILEAAVEIRVSWRAAGEEG